VRLTALKNVCVHQIRANSNKSFADFFEASSRCPLYPPKADIAECCGNVPFGLMHCGLMGQ
jgi:hypothetical protein